MVDQVRRMVLKGLAGLGAGAAMMPLMPTRVMAAIAQTSDPLLVEMRRRAARLANYATYGANEATVNRIVDIGWEAWVDEQMAMPVRPLFPGATLTTDKPTETQFYAAWWTNALVAPDQLHQRVAFALSQWFVISSDHPFLSGRIWTVVNYYDMLLEGAKGNFKDLLFQVSTHPAMCAYLSSLYNAKADPATGTIPDENYAREVMQLFTMGAEKRWSNGNFALDDGGNRIPNYDETDVQELARVFTGIGVADAAAWGKETGNWLVPVIEYPEYRDYDSKVVLGTAIPAGLSLFDDIQAALDILMSKRNTVAGNFARFMIQRLTVSNPRYDYVGDVAAAFRDSGWDIPTLVRAIMLHPDAIDGRSDAKCETGKLKEPLLWYAAARRAIAPARDQALQPVTGPLFDNNEPRTATTFDQAPLAAPSVFGFFPWDYQPDAIKGEGTDKIQYVYPEGYVYNWTNVVTVSNKLWGNFVKKDADVVRFKTFLEAGATDEEFADYVLDQLLFGNHRAALREELIGLLSTRGNTEYTGKLRDALMLALHSPDFIVNNLPQEV